MANNCVAGTVYVKVDGRQLSVRGSCTISPNTRTRTAVVGLDGPHGFQCVFRMPYISVEVTNRTQFPMTDIQNVEDATVTAELENGEVWVLRNAAQTADLEMEASEGSYTARFDGFDMRRQMSAA